MKILILEGLYGNNKGKKYQWRLKRTNLKVGDTVVLNCHDWKIVKVMGERKKSMFPKGTIFSEYSTGFISNSFYEAIEKIKKEVKKMRIFNVLLSEKVYIVQGDMTEQTAKVIMHVFHGSWMLKEVRYNTECRIYSRSDWRFLKNLATYVEYLCINAGADKLKIDKPKDI